MIFMRFWVDLGVQKGAQNDQTAHAKIFRKKHAKKSQGRGQDAPARRNARPAWRNARVRGNLIGGG